MAQSDTGLVGHCVTCFVSGVVSVVPLPAIAIPTTGAGWPVTAAVGNARRAVRLCQRATPRAKIASETPPPTTPLIRWSQVTEGAAAAAAALAAPMLTFNTEGVGSSCGTAGPSGPEIPSEHEGHALHLHRSQLSGLLAHQVKQAL